MGRKLFSADRMFVYFFVDVGRLFGTLATVLVLWCWCAFCGELAFRDTGVPVGSTWAMEVRLCTGHLRAESLRTGRRFFSADRMFVY